MTDEAKKEFLKGLFEGATLNVGQFIGVVESGATVNYNDHRCSRDTATKTDEMVKRAVQMLMDARDAQGNYIMQNQEQWYAGKAVLTQLCGFPVKPADFERSLKNLELNQLRVHYVYDSVRKVHVHQLPNNVELWHQYQNTADEYSRKQVVVAVKLIELLSEVKA